MRRLEVIQQTKRAILRAGREKLEGLIADDIIGMSAQAQRDAVGDHLRIVVFALPGKDDPLIEVCRHRLEVPLADEARVITGSAKKARERRKIGRHARTVEE